MPQLRPTIRRRGSEGKDGAVFSEELAALFCIGESSGHYVPEFGGVAHDLQMGKLMDYDVFDNVGREHHVAPAEAEGAVRRAASPTAALSCLSMTRNFFFRPIRDHHSSTRGGMWSWARARYQASEALTEGIAALFGVEGNGDGDAKCLGVEFDDGFGHVGRLDYQGIVAAEVWDGVAGDEAQGLGKERALGHLFDDPGGAVDDYGPDFLVGCPGGSRYEEAVGLENSMVFLRRGLRTRYSMVVPLKEMRSRAWAGNLVRRDAGVTVEGWHSKRHWWTANLP